MVVVPEHGCGGAGEAAQLFVDEANATLRATEIITCQDGEVRLEGLGDGDRMADAFWRGLTPDVEVGKLNHPQAVVRWVEIREPEDPALGSRKVDSLSRGRQSRAGGGRRKCALEKISPRQRHGALREPLSKSGRVLRDAKTSAPAGRFPLLGAIVPDPQPNPGVI